MAEERKLSTPELKISSAEEFDEDGSVSNNSDDSLSDSQLLHTPMLPKRMQKREKPQKSPVEKQQRRRKALKAAAVVEEVASESEGFSDRKSKIKFRKEQQQQRKQKKASSLHNHVDKVSKQLGALKLFPKPFKSLAIHQEPFDEQDTSSGRATPKKISSPDRLDFANERIEFHRSFKREVRLGDLEQMKNDNLETGLPIKRERGKGVVVRMGSSNENHDFQDVLWLNLQAFWAGLKLDKENFADSLKTHDEHLYQSREQKICVLNELRTFAITASLKTSNILNSLSFVPVSNEEDDEKCWIGLDRSYLEEQKACISQVGSLLRKYERFRSLYPNSKSMALLLDKSELFNQNVQERIKVLYVWYNISNDVCRKINQVGVMLGVTQTDALDWPCIDYSSPCSSPSSSSPSHSPSPISREGSSNLLTVADRSYTHSSSSTGTTMDRSFTGEASDAHLSANNRDEPLSRSHSDLDMSSCALYKHFVEKSFRFGGMRDVMKQMFRRLGRTLEKARRALEVTRGKGHATPVRRSLPMAPAELHFQHVTPINPRIVVTYDDSCSYVSSETATGSNTTQTTSLDSPFVGNIQNSLVAKLNVGMEKKRIILGPQICKESDPELGEFGVCHLEFERMRLPSFAPSFLFLLRVPLDLVHQWLKLRVKTQSGQGSESADVLTLRTLILDCHDCLIAAVEVKCYYQEYAQSVTIDEMELEKLLVEEMAEFETDLKKMFELYLHYVLSWATHQYEDKSSEWIQTLMAHLESEWKFAKKIAINVLSGESDAARTFCLLCNRLQEKIGKYMQDGCDNINEALNDGDSMGEDDDSEESGRDRSGSGSSSDPDVYNSPRGHHDDRPSAVLERCRKFKRIICDVRERSLRLLTFCKMLRTDLEITAKYSRTCELSKLFDALLKDNYVLVTTPMHPAVVSYMMFAEAGIAQDVQHLLLLLNVTCGRDDHEVPHDLAGKPGSLLLVKCDDFKADKELWEANGGKYTKVNPDADTELCLRYMKVLDDAVHLVVVNSAGLAAQRRELAKKSVTDLVKLIDIQCSCHDLIATEMDNLKDSGLKNRQIIADQIKNMSEEILMDQGWNSLDRQERSTYRDCVIQAYNFAFEYHRELAKLISSPERRKKLGLGLLGFVKQWSEFVMKTVEKGKGVRPRWANGGFNFLLLSTQPLWTAELTDEQFAELESEIEKCTHHLIGHVKLNVEEDSAAKGRSHSLGIVHPPLRLSTSKPNLFQSTSTIGTYQRSSTIEGKDVSRGTSQENRLEDPKIRLKNSLAALEAKRQEKLQATKTIGKEVESHGEQNYRRRLDGRKRVPFHWQRLEQKIGEGRFGTVYIALNLDTKALMAMKEMKLNRDDHALIKQLLDEIQNVLSLTYHPNLVKYYGLETHRNDVLIFMEYCNEGNLEEACRQNLDYTLIRQYTFHILQGVTFLHRNNILHRDIKPQNIFLTSKACQLKLGDFGSSVRLKNMETMRGEINELTGTVNYMAPEVIDTGSEGYGRAADVWSIGCTVLHMITGKVPYAEKPYYSIMYLVGSTKCHPPIPETTTHECKNFLGHCFEKDSTSRLEAGKLLEQPFAKVRQLSDPIDLLSPQN